MRLFTVGHSTHTTEFLLELLGLHAIDVVCDVRSHPYSGHNPQFNQQSLKSTLKKGGMDYVFLGKELGARSDNPSCYIDGKVQYNHLVSEPIFQDGIRRLQQGMESHTVALMCAEKDPVTCHRMILICRELCTSFEIHHILADGSIETNEEAEVRLVSLLRIVPDMFKSEAECIEEAYVTQGRKIAYELPNTSAQSSR